MKSGMEDKWKEEAVDTLAASIASLLQMPKCEVRRLLPQASYDPTKESEILSECSGTSGYDSLRSPTSPLSRKDSAQADEDEELAAVSRALADELEKGRESRIPKPGYLCRICFRPAKHLTQCATPYKGPKQCYGEFACPSCKRKWRSGKSFAGQGQNCKFCRCLVFPHRQYSLERAVAEGRWPQHKLGSLDPNYLL